LVGCTENENQERAEAQGWIEDQSWGKY
jgi:hypothetical protein